MTYAGTGHISAKENEMTQSNSKQEESKRKEAQGEKATRLDGNPNPKGASSSPLKPKDDTPFVLKKTSGPRDDQKK
jgi:hypothetical protein